MAIRAERRSRAASLVLCRMGTGVTDCHTSDIGHWFAMTDGSKPHRTSLKLMTSPQRGNLAAPPGTPVSHSQLSTLH